MAKDEDILEEARELFEQCEEREADNRDEALDDLEFAVFVVFVGSAFLMSTFEKARDGALGVAMRLLASWLPGGRR